MMVAGAHGAAADPQWLTLLPTPTLSETAQSPI